MMPLTEAALMAWGFAFARLAGWTLFDPLLARLPVAGRLMLAAALAAALAPGLATPPASALGAAVLPMLALEVLWGAGLALGVAVVLTLTRLVVLWTGHTATAGLLTLTPQQGETSDAAWRALAGWLAVLAFLGAGGHLLVVAALRESFAVLPVAALPAMEDLRSLVESAGWLFATGAALALPLLALALLVQLAFFVLARTTPGLDMFSMGLGLAAVGLLAAWVVAVPVIARGMSDGLAQMSLWFAALTGIR